MENTNEVIYLQGVKINNLTSDQLNETVKKLVETSANRALILNVNIHAMNIAHKHQWFKDFLNCSSITFCDGEGVRLAARIMGIFIKEKITYNRWIWNLLKLIQSNGYSIYLMGSKDATIKKAVEKINEDYPGINVAGYRNGFIEDDEDLKATIKTINDAEPNILLLGMGMPVQEKWLMQNKEKVNFNITLTGGAVFEYIAGNTRMTPNIFYTLKLEWLYRFLQEPRRLFKRYFVGNPIFIFRVLQQKFSINKNK
ncbi:MAG TPA: WecB/TagA/CpsF family glycosyltransferase [Cyclobacteriaceae bacterium]